MNSCKQKKRMFGLFFTMLLFFGAFSFLQTLPLYDTVAADTGNLTITLDAPETYTLGDDQTSRHVNVDIYINNPTGIGIHSFAGVVIFDPAIFTFVDYHPVENSPLGAVIPSDMFYSNSIFKTVNGYLHYICEITNAPTTAITAVDFKVGTLELSVNEGAVPGTTTFHDYQPTYMPKADNLQTGYIFTYNPVTPITITLQNAPAVPEYTVDHSVTGGNGTLTASAGGSAVSSGATVAEGSNVTFTASPASGYRVKEWKLNGSVVSGNKTNTYTLNAISSNAAVIVEYEAFRTITYGVMGGHGTLAAKIGGASIGSSPAAVADGSSIVFTASPNTGYRVKEWKLNGSSVSGNTSDTYTLNTVSANAAVIVEYEAINHTVTFSVTNGNGSLNASVGGASIGSSPAAVIEGSSVTFTASPDTGYKVKEWKLNGSAVSGNTSNTYTVNGISSNTTVTVEYESTSLNYTVAYSVTGGNGTLAASAGGSAVSSGATVAEGSNVTFTASPASGYRVKEWKLNGSAVSGNKTNTYTIGGISSNATVTAEFESIPSYTVTFSAVNGNGSVTAADDGSAVSSGTAAEIGSRIVFTASPASGYRVKEWKLNGSSVSGNTATYTIGSISSNVTVTAEFEQIASGDLTVTYGVAGGGGSLTASVSGTSIGASPASVTEGSIVTFTASPNAGYRVKEWKLNGSAVSGNTSNTYTVNGISSNATVTVGYEIIYRTVTFSVAGGNGTLAASAGGSAVSPGATVAEGSDVTFTASPDPGYRVTEWVLNGSPIAGNVLNSYTISGPSADVTLTVEFEAVPSGSMFTVTFYDDDDLTVIYQASAPAGTLISEVTPDPPDRLGYDFVRWAGGHSPWATVTGDHSFYAVYSSNDTPKYTVLFYDEGGEDVIQALSAPLGTNIASLFPNTLQKAGGMFVGWDGYEPNMIVSGNVTFVAIYAYTLSDSHTLTFLAQDGSVLKTVRNVLTGTPVSMHLASIPYRSGYEFTGWDGFNANMKVTESMTFKAVYKAESISYIVTFDTAGGSDAPEQQVVIEGENIAKPDDPARGLYDFKGWYSGEEEWDFENDAVMDNMTLTAKWEVQGEMQERLPWLIAGLILLILIIVLLRRRSTVK